MEKNEKTDLNLNDKKSIRFEGDAVIRTWEDAKVECSTERISKTHTQIKVKFDDSTGLLPKELEFTIPSEYTADMDYFLDSIRQRIFFENSEHLEEELLLFSQEAIYNVIVLFNICLNHPKSLELGTIEILSNKEENITLLNTFATVAEEVNEDFKKLVITENPDAIAGGDVWLANQFGFVDYERVKSILVRLVESTNLQVMLDEIVEKELQDEKIENSPL